MSSKVLGNLERGLSFVLSAPAGSGKNTLLEMLIDEFPCVKESVSCTTRPIRHNEVDGVHYDFMSKDEFEKKIENGEFLEHAKYCGHYYGTLRSEVEGHQDNGCHCVSVIEVVGAGQFKERHPATFIFVCAPSLFELRKRLEKRKTETPESIEERIAKVKEEVKNLALYDYLVINDDLQLAYQVFRSIFIAEEHKEIKKTWKIT